MSTVLRDFAEDETGGITPLMLGLFLGILFATGISMDLLNHEAERADLPAALDRGVLAAAALEQELDPRSVVADYVRKGIAADQTATVEVLPDFGLNGRQIRASAAHQMPTAFLTFVGMEQLNVAAAAAATQASGNVEISLVLDISGSMAEPSIDGHMSKLENLKIAAKGFIDEITDYGTNRNVTINLVRYAGQVNPGRTMFSLLGGQRFHEQSSCLELDAEDFIDTALPEAKPRTQVPHFHAWEIDGETMDWGWCPSDGEAIVYASSDAEALKQEIDGIRLHDGTGTHNAMKWGLALLDPDSRDEFAALAEADEIEPEYAHRPYGWGDPDSQKVIVLMTGGKITEQYRPEDPTDERLDDTELEHLASTDGREFEDYEVLDASEGASRFSALCDEAKAPGRDVQVFTIGFETDIADEDEIQDCATDPERDFWFVQGREIEDAFHEIGMRIKKLKLVN